MNAVELLERTILELEKVGEKGWARGGTIPDRILKTGRGCMLDYAAKVLGLRSAVDVYSDERIAAWQYAYVQSGLYLSHSFDPYPFVWILNDSAKSCAEVVEKLKILKTYL